MLELIAAAITGLCFILFIATLIKDLPSENPIFVLNGFYTGMREKYTKASAKIHYYCVEFDPKACSWTQFTDECIGTGDPAQAAEGSIRRQLASQWKECGLQSKPTMEDNAIHAAASPFESMAERFNWLEILPKDSNFAKAMTAGNIKKDQIFKWAENPVVERADGTSDPIFKIMKGMNVDEALKEMKGICDRAKLKPGKFNSYGKNECFVYLKPSASTTDVDNLVKTQFGEWGITIVKEGDIDGATIAEKGFFDKHFPSLAKTASVGKSDLEKLEISKEEKAMFESKFGESWEHAVSYGKVFGSKNACGKLGVTGTKLGAMWASIGQSSKVSFGNGVQIALIDPSQGTE